MAEKKPLFSVTIQDMEIQTFTSGGNGGQNQNRRHTGVRLIHHPSGARGEARDSRNQLQNKRAAFHRLAESAQFKAWVRLEAAKRTGVIREVEASVERQMDPINLKVEVGNGTKWVVTNTEQMG